VSDVKRLKMIGKITERTIHTASLIMIQTGYGPVGEIPSFMRSKKPVMSEKSVVIPRIILWSF